MWVNDDELRREWDLEILSRLTKIYSNLVKLCFPKSHSMRDIHNPNMTFSFFSPSHTRELFYFSADSATQNNNRSLDFLIFHGQRIFSFFFFKLHQKFSHLMYFPCNFIFSHSQHTAFLLQSEKGTGKWPPHPYILIECHSKIRKIEKFP